jgi:hypothetical protein
MEGNNMQTNIPPTGDEQQDVLSTQKVWAPIAFLAKAHVDAINELSSAVARGDEAAQKNASETILWIEQQQHAAHMGVLAYQVNKARSRG